MNTEEREKERNVEKGNPRDNPLLMYDHVDLKDFNSHLETYSCMLKIEGFESLGYFSMGISLLNSTCPL